MVSKIVLKIKNYLFLLLVLFVDFLMFSSYNPLFGNHAARLAVQAGAAGIIVSNHGGRQLDYVPATIMALEEVH